MIAREKVSRRSPLDCLDAGNRHGECSSDFRPEIFTLRLASANNGNKVTFKVTFRSRDRDRICMSNRFQILSNPTFGLDSRMLMVQHLIGGLAILLLD